MKSLSKADPEAIQTSSKPGRQLSIAGLFSALLILVAFATAGGFLGRFWWIFDLASSFRFQYLQAATLSLVVFAVYRKRRHILVSGVIAAINLGTILPVYWNPGIPASSSPQLRALLCNVYSGNQGKDQLLSLIRNENPDIIVLIEVNDAWIDALSEIRMRYPHFLEQPEEDDFGIALYSRIQPDYIELFHLGKAQVAAVEARFLLNGSAVSVIGCHALPPGSKAGWEERNQELQELAQRIGAEASEAILLADLNVTPWSPHFNEFLRTSGLRDSRQGFGLQPSWPVFSPPLRIPIDHCLVSSGISVHDRRLAPSPGSDHYPIVLDFSLAE